MKTKKEEKAPSRFTRGEKVTAKSARHHGRKASAKSPSKQELVEKMAALTPL